MVQARFPESLEDFGFGHGGDARSVSGYWQAGAIKVFGYRYLDTDMWSRRIDLEHRLIYRVSHTQIDFLACRYHYE